MKTQTLNIMLLFWAIILMFCSMGTMAVPNPPIADDCPESTSPAVDEHGCTVNQTYVDCEFNCPNDYCPKDDGPTAVCSPPMPCDPGCRCRINYRISVSGNCILASECPPVDCTRPNEVYDSCPSACLQEDCESRFDQPTTCNTLLLNCQPRCVCKNNYWRNSTGICVKACECCP